MAETMLERVAEGLYLHFSKESSLEGWRRYSEEHDETYSVYMDDARAAVQATLRPSDAFIAELAARWSCRFDDAQYRWQAAIRAILEGK